MGRRSSRCDVDRAGKRVGYESHRSLKNAAIRLAAEREDPLIQAYFGLAEKFHVYFYHGTMEDWERDADRPLVHDLVRRMLK